MAVSLQSEFHPSGSATGANGLLVSVLESHSLRCEVPMEAYVTDKTPDTEQQAPEDEALIQKLSAQWKEAKEWANKWRKEAIEDRKFYDGDQWTDEQKRQLKDNGRPATVINRIAKAINNVAGRERNGRYSWKALPRGESDVRMADAITKALSYVADQSKSKYVLSRAFKEALKGPLGWVEVGYDDSDPTKEPIFVRQIPWDEMFWDPHTSQPDLEDARYVIKTRIVDLDLATATFPEKAEALKEAVSQHEKRELMAGHTTGEDYGNFTGIQYGPDEWCDSKRKRVMLREHWYWKQEKATFIVYSDGRVVEFNAADMRQVMSLQADPQATTHSGTKKKFYYCVVAGSTLLSEDESPYPFDRFPFVPVWAYVDDEGNPYGVIRNQKDPQRELNVARSRFNESIRSRWMIYKSGALGNKTEDQINRQLARSNFSFGVDNPDQVEIGSDKPDAALWSNLMDRSQSEIDDVAGLNEASYGDLGNEKSGKAIQARVNQQGLTFGEIFDNLKFARLQIGELLLSLMQAFYTPQKLQRITESAIIREGGNDLEWVGQALAGPIEQMRFDIIIEDQAETFTERQSAMQQAIELVGLMPDQIKALMVPEVVRMSDFASKEAMAQKAEMGLQMMMGGAPQGAPPAPPEVPPEMMQGPPTGNPMMDPSMMPPAA